MFARDLNVSLLTSKIPRVTFQEQAFKKWDSSKNKINKENNKKTKFFLNKEKKSSNIRKELIKTSTIF